MFIESKKTPCFLEESRNGRFKKLKWIISASMSSEVRSNNSHPMIQNHHLQPAAEAALKIGSTASEKCQEILSKWTELGQHKQIKGPFKEWRTERAVSRREKLRGKIMLLSSNGLHNPPVSVVEAKKMRDRMLSIVKDKRIAAQLGDDFTAKKIKETFNGQIEALKDEISAAKNEYKELTGKSLRTNDLIKIEQKFDAAETAKKSKRKGDTTRTTPQKIKSTFDLIKTLVKNPNKKISDAGMKNIFNKGARPRWRKNDD